MAVYVGLLDPLGYVPSTVFIGIVILWILGIDLVEGARSGQHRHVGGLVLLFSHLWA